VKKQKKNKENKPYFQPVKYSKIEEEKKIDNFF